MKIFDKFTLSDKRDELVIRYYDEAMSTGKMHTVYKLSDISSGKLKWEDVEADFADFTEFSRVQICRSRMCFFSTRENLKSCLLKDSGRVDMCNYREIGLIRQLARNEGELRYYRRMIKIKKNERDSVLRRSACDSIVCLSVDAKKRHRRRL